ncbi:MAG: hypothetical protein GKS07_10105 [Nitrosopumilus sp.]|nr:MAG: hypothetical protein GKS07_10105 [Nitrosopumilus sp.]
MKNKKYVILRWWEMKTRLLIIIPIIAIGALLGILFVPLVDAVEAESDKFAWKFCDQEKQFNYKIINGTLHDTAHLRLQGTNNCESNNNTTDFQLQLFHTSNNQTDFTLIVPDDLEFDEIDVRVVGMGYLESFQLNDIHRSLEFSNFVHDKNGLVTIILDFKGVEN